MILDVYVKPPALDIGFQFETHTGDKYVVEGWCRRRGDRSGPIPKATNAVRLEFCTREQAEYVHGRGVNGRIMRMEDIARWRTHPSYDTVRIAQCMAIQNKLLGRALG